MTTTERVYPTINADNLRAVLAQIENHPETWKRSDWHCGTSHCFFGWAQILSGKEPETRTVRPDGRKWLGLTKYEADILSAGSNTLAEIQDLVATFTSAGYDRDGYDRAGYDRDGYDRAGYDRDGYDRAGYDRDGYNHAGYDRAGYDRDGYNHAGYDTAYFDVDGLNPQNLTREEVKAINAGSAA